MVVIEADHESVGVLFRDDVARGYGSLSYVRNPVPSAVKPGAFLRIWGGFGNLVLGVTVMVMPPLDALLSHYAIERSLPPAIEGEHLWLREP